MVSVSFTCVTYNRKVTSSVAVGAFWASSDFSSLLVKPNVATDIARFALTAAIWQTLAWNSLPLMHCIFKSQHPAFNLTFHKNLIKHQKRNMVFVLCSVPPKFPSVYKTLCCQFPLLPHPREGAAPRESECNQNWLSWVHGVGGKKNTFQICSRESRLQTSLLGLKSSLDLLLYLVQLSYLERLSCCHNNVLCRSAEMLR